MRKSEDILFQLKKLRFEAEELLLKEDVSLDEFQSFFKLHDALKIDLLNHSPENIKRLISQLPDLEFELKHGLPFFYKVAHLFRKDIYSFKLAKENTQATLLLYNQIIDIISDFVYPRLSQSNDSTT